MTQLKHVSKFTGMGKVFVIQYDFDYKLLLKKILQVQYILKCDMYHDMQMQVSIFLKKLLFKKMLDL